MTHKESPWPWSTWLKFSDPNLEASFLNGPVRATWRKFETQTCLIILLMSPMKILSAETRNPHCRFAYNAWITLNGIFLTLFYLGHSHFQPESYWRHRSRLHAFHRVIIAMGGAMMVYLEDVWTTTVPLEIFIRILSRTALSCLFFPALGLALKFHLHVYVQGIATLASVFWIPDLCRACNSSTEISDAVNIIGHTTEVVLGRAVWLGLPIHKPVLEPGEYSCWVVGGFFHLLVGFLVPSVLVYASECWSRAVFLKSRSAMGHELAKNGWNSGLVLCGVCFPMMMIAAWYMLKDLSNILADPCGDLTASAGSCDLAPFP